MKTKALSSFFVLFAIAAGIVAMTPAAFADHSEVTIEAAMGSGAPGCEETAEGCYIPSTATVDVGGKVIMSNPDTAAHTFTAGSPTDGPSGEFDSGLIMAGGLYEYSPDTVGEIPYFCMVHPWMQGLIIVQEVGAEEEEEVHDEEAVAHTDDDGAVTETHDEDLYVTLDHDISGATVTEMEIDMDSTSLIIEIDAIDNGSITVTLPRDVIDATINGEDDDLFVIVDGEEVDFEESKTSADRTLTIEFPAGAEEIEIIGSFVVPEFGTIAVMIFAIAVISIIAVSSRSRLSIIPRL
jgi:predicted secreted protein with PEFG-CTERM motif